MLFNSPRKFARWQLSFSTARQHARSEPPLVHLVIDSAKRHFCRSPRPVQSATEPTFSTNIFVTSNVLDKICTAGLRCQCARIWRRVPPLESSAWRWRAYTHRVRLQPSVSLIVAADYLGDTPRLSFRCNVSCVARQEIESAIGLRTNPQRKRNSMFHNPDLCAANKLDLQSELY